MRQNTIRAVGSVLSVLYVACAATASDLDEFTVKREPVFEFAQKPAVTRAGDQISVAFESKGLCDVTVAIEDARGRIVRHLASGVLGPKAPEPLQKDSKKQTVVWDGKNDQGVYVDDKDSHSVRVSLGLKPQFERSLFWCPQKRVGSGASPVLCASPDGIYVAEGCGVDSVRLYDHNGDYARTVYPFPRGKLAEIKGMETAVFPQDGQTLPVKRGPKHASTLLRSGDNMVGSPGKYGRATSAMAVQGSRMALAYYSLDRLGTDGSSGGLDLHGPETSFIVGDGKERKRYSPRSAALSPDGKWLYLTGYNSGGEGCEWLHCVTRLDYAGGTKMELFAGTWNPEDVKNKDKDLAVPTSVAVDSQGRVYVADFMNNRIQVYAADGKVQKSVKVKHPAEVFVHPKTGEIYVGSWMLKNRFVPDIKYSVPAVLMRLGSLDDPAVKATFPLPFNSYNATVSWNRTAGLQYRMAVDFWADQPSVWIVPGVLFDIGGWGVVETKKNLSGTGILLLREEGGKLVIKRDFDKDTVKAVVRAAPPVISRQRLYVNPVNGKLYVAEGDCAVMKGVNQLVEIDPDTGKVKPINLPMAIEDMAIGMDGNFYLRADFEVGRFDPTAWREIPWDYGEERKSAGFSDGRTTALVSALPLPGTGRYPCWWHMGGMAINARGELAVMTCNFNKAMSVQTDENPYAKRDKLPTGGKPYTPALYPGRALGYETHIWDSHGKLTREDALPGFSTADGLGLDKDGNLYVLAAMNRVLDGKPYFLPWAATLIKMKAGKGKAMCASDKIPVKLGSGAFNRPPDVNMWGFGKTWIEGAEWFYGGVGFVGANSGGSCVCWNARPALDLFARSFAPEVDHYSVAVLDSNGNLVLRVGQYGNVDDGVPLNPAGGPANGRSIGGDEVAIFHAPYVGTHTDRRLFIADPGNNRIASVKLGYHAEEKIALKDVADQGKP